MRLGKGKLLVTLLAILIGNSFAARAPRVFASDTMVFPMAMITGNAVSLSDNGDISKIAPNFVSAKPKDQTIRKKPGYFLEMAFSLHGAGNTHLLNQRRHPGKKALESSLEIANTALNIPQLKYTKLFAYAKMKSLLSLGIYAQANGDLRAAEDYYNQAEKTHKKHKLNSRSLLALKNNQATLLKDLGKFDLAYELYSESKKLTHARHRIDSNAASILHNNISLFEYEIGSIENSIRSIHKSRNLSPSLLNRSLDNDKIRINEALLLLALNQPDSALTLIKESQSSIYDKIGKRNVFYANTLTHLASANIALNKNKKALFQLDQATVLFKKLYGADHLYYAESLVRIARLYEKMKYYRPAEYLYETILSSRENKLAFNHQKCAETRFDLAEVYWNRDKISKSRDMFEAGIESYFKIIDDQFHAMSENEKEQFWAKIKPSFDRYYDFVYANHQTDSTLASTLYKCVSKLKGLLYTSSNKTRAILQNHPDTLIQQKYFEWVSLKERLVYLYSVSDADLKEIENAENKTQNLEREFAKLVKGSMKPSENSSWTADSTAMYLEKDEVAVELVRVSHETKDTTYPVYMALIIDADTSTKINVATLDAKHLEDRYYQYYKNAIKYHIADEKSLEHLWEWVDTSVVQYSTIFLSVDGVFNKVNINTLSTGDNEYYLDTKVVIPVSKTRNIKQMKFKTHADILETAELFGFPHYGDKGLISSLPGTLKEVDKIDDILKGQSINIHKNTGDNACEETVKEIKQPSILHLATHGFFLEPTANTNEKKIGDNLSKASENPLLLSGLYFCNAENAENKAIGTGDANSDGILTSYEAMSLDLSQTELVVLSACETGVGTIRNGEGVYGLQRAFQVAGANAVIMSLWKVDDKATQELMTMFYSKWTDHDSKIEAFRASILEMRKKYKHPYYWGAFMMLSE